MSFIQGLENPNGSKLDSEGDNEESKTSKGCKRFKNVIPEALLRQYQYFVPPTTTIEGD